jgi:hypothetical protein
MSIFLVLINHCSRFIRYRHLLSNVEACDGITWTDTVVSRAALNPNEVSIPLATHKWIREALGPALLGQRLWTLSTFVLY